MKKTAEKKAWKYRLAAGGTLLFAALLLQLAARGFSGFGEWYANAVYPLLVHTVGRVSSLFPFSLVEILLYLFVIGMVLWIAVGIVRMVGRKRRGGRFLSKKSLISTGSSLLLIAGALLFSYTACCGVNYYREPFSQKEGFVTEKQPMDQLEELCWYLLDQLTQESAQIETDGEGRMVLGDEEEAKREAVRCMQALGETYSSLSGYYPGPKSVLWSDFLSYQDIQGIYSPFTIEANYNGAVTDYNIPSTMCHELSHLKGFMREDEANFIAFLACRGSGMAEFRYSGYMLAYIHSSNALYNKGGTEAYQRLWQALPESVIQDFAANTAFWDKYEGPVAEVSNAVNDTYLKVNSQEEGVASYGRMVDLLLAFYNQLPQEKKG